MSTDRYETDRRDGTDVTICILDGLARSGTTFTGAVLNSLPETLCLTDTFKLPLYYQDMHGSFAHPSNLSELRKPLDVDFGKPIPSYSSFEERCVIPTLASLEDPKKEAQVRERLRARVEVEQNLSYLRVFELFYQVLGGEYHVSVVGGKTTYCHAYKQQMLANLPNLKWIDIVRDVRAVLCSGSVSGHHRLAAGGIVDPWRDQVNSIQSMPTQLRERRHLLVRYEDLILEKKKTIEKMVDFLKLREFSYDEWEKKPILKNDGTPFGTHSSFDESGRPVEVLGYRQGGDFDATPVERWKAFLPRSMRWLLTRIYRKKLAFLGYPIESPPPLNPLIFLTYARLQLWRAASVLCLRLKRYL